MSTFNISDITFASAYSNAVATAKNSDQRNAARYLNTGEGMNVMKSINSLIRRIAAIANMRPIASHLTSRPV